MAHLQSAIDTIIKNPHFQNYIRDTKSDGRDIIIVLKNKHGQWCKLHHSCVTTDDNREYFVDVPELRGICKKCGTVANIYKHNNTLCRVCDPNYCYGMVMGGTPLPYINNLL